MEKEKVFWIVIGHDDKLYSNDDGNETSGNRFIQASLLASR